MNIEQLKTRLASQVTEVDGVRIGKLNAVDGIEFSKRFSAVPEDASFEAMADAYSFLLSKTIVDEHGAKTLDSDEGRALLLQLDRATFVALGEAATSWNLADAKKN